MSRSRPAKPGSRSRGEVNEIVAKLEALSAMDGRRREVVALKREAFQRLVRYLTAGIDMSAAFVPATKCVALSKGDLPLKKMLYLYLGSAARQNEAVALLVVQAMLNDCGDADPAIRGLAVRSMCSLHVPDLMENVFQAVDAGLRDPHPYVRDAAVMGVLKYHAQDAGATRDRGLPDRVRAMLEADQDPQVVANCLYVCQQLGALAGGLPRGLAVALLNHVRAFSDWAQCLVLGALLDHHRPASERERFDTLELLDFGLAHANSAVVLATAKLFLHYTANYPDQYARVLEAIKGPLQALLLGREPEIVFAALSNLLALAQRHPAAFADLAPDLFCRPEDPSYLKTLKIEGLVAAAGPGNAYDVAEELSFYARDPDADVARAAVRSVARVALAVPSVDGVLDRLLLFLGHPRADVAAEAVAAMAGVLRRFPAAAGPCVPAVAEAPAAALAVPAARAAYVWVLGEFGQQLQDAPYVLEAMVGRFGEEPEEVKLALLSAAAKLFFKRPPECRPALGAALAAGAADPAAAVRDRAALYLRLLRDAGAEEARRVVAAARPPAAGFEEAQSAEVRDRIFDEWNTLSVIYRAPAATFIDPGEGPGAADVAPIGGGGEGEGGAHGGGGGADGGTALLMDLDADSDGGAAGSEGGGALGSGGGGGGGGGASFGDLYSLDGGGGGGGGASPASPAHQPAPSLLTQQQAQQRDPTPQSGLDALGDLLGGGGAGNGSSGPPPPAAAAAAAAAAQQQQQLLGGGLDDLLGGFGASPSSAAPPPQRPQQGQQGGASSWVQLGPPGPLSAADFQTLWAQWTPSARGFSQELSPSALAAIQSRGHKDFLDFVRQANVVSFATPRGGGAPPLRFLFHAQRAGAAGPAAGLALAQVTVAGAPAPSAAVVVKAGDADVAAHVEETLRTLLLSL